jgi:hypothetical protein
MFSRKSLRKMQKRRLPKPKSDFVNLPFDTVCGILSVAADNRTSKEHNLKF